jgi:TetR/AcrR family transcriptional regulator, hemagglutinin/protease regulatory protein
VPAGTPKRHWLRTEVRRPQLLARAVGVFARRGFERGAHAEVARAAGVSVPTVFGYFPTRDELVRGVLGEVDRHMSALVRRCLSRPGDVHEVLLGLARDFARTVDDDPDYVRVWLGWSTAIGHPCWPLWVELQERMIREIAAAIRAGQRRGEIEASIDARAAARVYAGEAHMVALLKFTHPRGEIDAVLHHVVESALRVPGGGARERRAERTRSRLVARRPSS